MNFTRIGISLFSVAVVLGPFYTVSGYNSLGNLISQLGAQNTQNSFIMVMGFLALGFGLLVDGGRWFSPRAIPFMAFGRFMALAGLFAHMPIDTNLPHSKFSHEVHGILATLAGISMTTGLVWRIQNNSRRRRRKK